MTSNDDHSRPYAKKKFGQHFLVNRNIIDRIVKTAEVKEGDHVLEIGPGRGALTDGLVSAGAKVTAIEVDRDMVECLREKFGDAIEIVERDALKISFEELASQRGVKFKVVSNLPYNISGPILAKFIDGRRAFTAMVLMFQKEVGRRIAAKPDTKEYGILSVLSQVYAEVKLEFDVSKNQFSPRPKVDSTIVSFRFLSSPKVDVPDEAFFRSVVRSAFGQRRKTLMNSLKPLGFGREETEEALRKAGVDPVRRGETLTLNEFSALAKELYALKGRQ